MDSFKTNIDIHDGETIYCRKLGHHLKFSYCRIESEMMPCSGIIKCWSDRLSILEFLDDHFSADELEKVFAPPDPKITSLVNLIQKAKALKDS